ncbi:MAG: primosomal protein N' [Opitutales bacterium]|nr:primosomal protein N' [Opitutales bacterium]
MEASERAKAVAVALFSGIDRELTYLVPRSLGGVETGSMVRVPLRGGSAQGVVIRVFDASELSGEKFKFKFVHSKVQNEPVITPDLVELAFWMRDYYGCTLQGAFESMIPAVVRSGKAALEAYEVSLAKTLSEEEAAKLARKAPQQAAVLGYLTANPEPILKSALLKITGAASQTVDALAKKGIVSVGKKIVQRSAYDDELAGAELVSSPVKELNAEQKKALEEILSDAKSGAFKTRLLYGVTGSGKTEVYMRAMREVLEAGRSCIFLVPEIALTPQTVGRLRAGLGGRELVVWHSNLTDGQRLDAWRCLASGRARVVVGARSCIFAPLKDIGLIVVDEEHDGAYKQDKTPRYNGRDAAVMRAKICSAACVLGSATPSLETLNNARTGKYGLSEIRGRIDGRKLPLVHIADMRREKPGSILSSILREKLSQRLDNGEQAILFLNRRGYSKIFECPDCGEVEQCPHCSVSMTWHKRENLVKCHVCGYSERAPSACKKCGSPKAKWRGHGTQRLEDAVAQLFPSARIGRMDRDAMKRRDNYRKVLADFRTGKLDILIGTQMIAKGLDFPRVTLVGIIDADISLHMPDFRAAEKTYQLIVQVAGHAGRGDGGGEVVIQTMQPDAAPIQYAKRDDMRSFLEEELQTRREYSYPPSMRLIRHIFRARNEEKLQFFAEQWAKLATEKFGDICQIRGPAPAPLERSEDFYRWHIWYFCRNVKAVVREILELKKSFDFGDIEDVLDSDPMSLM